MLKQMGRTLQQTRVARKMTQSQLGALVDLPQSHISKIENGESDVQWTTLEQIANALGLSVVLVPTSLVALIDSLKKSSTGEKEKEPVPLVGNLKE